MTTRNNTVNTTYQLLRANPTMINKFRPPSHDESEEEDKRKRAASNAAKQKDRKRKRREKNPKAPSQDGGEPKMKKRKK
jgi:hypothetical protein